MSITVEQIKALTQPESNLVAAGYCPKCERKISGWKTPFGSFAPEIWEALRENNIDPATGHTENCPWKGWKP